MNNQRETRKQLIDDSIVVIGGIFAMATIVFVGLQNRGMI